MSDPMDRARSGYDAKLRAVAKLDPGLDPPLGVENQPVSKIEWVDPTMLGANDYNPNVVAPPEFKLLKVSLLADGWTQPIVVRPVGARYEIVDGFHRWLLATDPHIFQLAGGLVPIVVVNPKTGEDQRMSTIRHNRARGSHHVLAMANIVAKMLEDGVAPDEIGRRLQMEEEEIERLRDRGNMVKRGSTDEFNVGWTPV